MQFNIKSGTLQAILENTLLAGVLNQENEYATAKLAQSTRIAGESGFVDVNLDKFSVEDLKVVVDIASTLGDKSLVTKVKSLINVKLNPASAKIGSLKALPDALIAFISQDAIKGWIFKMEKDKVYLPWLLTGVKYYEGNRHSEPSVTVTVVANKAVDTKGSRDKNNMSSETFSFYRSHIVGRSVADLLSHYGFVHETPELHAEYEMGLETFIEFKSMDGEQFRGVGYAIQDERNTYYSASTSSKINLAHKFVNDESIIEREVVDRIDAPTWLVSEVNEYVDVPYHCRLYLFNTDLHRYQWIHSSYLSPYVYKTDLRNKLVLPETHHDLVDILASDMNVVMDDIVEGKSGGTTILCKGAPGLGKTLTAEVYSEVIQRPLYRVHSGQLGVDANSVEKNLLDILTKAKRWRAVLLIDEADVFIRQRGNDIDHNAVVAAFLRTLEYFDGLLFMTTNRQNDIDDAILSRCIAVIKYELPTQDDAKRIWQVLATQFGAEMSTNLIDALARKFNKASGRDIKELLKLTMKYCSGKEIALEEDAFRVCAVFRGLI